MGQSFAAVPSLYIFVFLLVLTVIISVLVVWPAVWSNQPYRRKAAYVVLDRLLKFILKICRSIWR
jgi:hypothetical protein